MTPDELRALAEALSRQRQADEHGIYCAVPRQAVDAAIKYLRAQADAQPVAWRTFDGEGNYDYRAYELNEDYADEWNRRNPNHVGWVEPLYTHPAPAAPQAEPKREPLTYEQLVSACYTYRHDCGLLDPDEQHLVIEEAGRWAKAFGIGGSDAE